MLQFSRHQRFTMIKHCVVRMIRVDLIPHIHLLWPSNRRSIKAKSFNLFFNLSCLCKCRELKLNFYIEFQLSDGNFKKVITDCIITFWSLLTYSSSQNPIPLFLRCKQIKHSRKKVSVHCSFHWMNKAPLYSEKMSDQI